jgi:hypothetical protein
MATNFEYDQSRTAREPNGVKFCYLPMEKVP